MARRRLWLRIRVEEDVVSCNVLVLQLLGNILGFGEEVAGDMFYEARDQRETEILLLSYG